MKNYKQFCTKKGRLSCDFSSHLPSWKLSPSKHWPIATLTSMESFLLHRLNGFVSKTSELSSVQWNINVTIVGGKKMKNLNLDYRSKNAQTDVLSFPTMNWDDKKSFFQAAQESQFSLGDIVICKDVLVKQAKQFQLSEMDEYLHLLVHGFLHLLGYDHELSAKDAKVMENHEKKILEDISRNDFVRK